ncbi:helix-turn-helix transcriptional regulator [Terasakiella brassicae]|nr:helix-turn-helix domain-containing protein [Terasakiella brassicae]
MSTAKKINLLTEGQVADMFGVDQSTLRRWRYDGCGPHFIRLGSNIRYRHEDIEDHLMSHRHQSTYEYYQGVEL